MANIDTYLKKIKEAIYGKDVRSSIHDGMEAINEEVENNTVKQNLLEQKYDEQIKELANENPQLPEIVDARCGFDTLGNLVKQKVYHFNTVQDMKNSLTLIPGDVVQTLGYYEANDGGASLYKIHIITNDDVDDNALLIPLYDDNLVAELILSDYVTPEQFGCYGDDVHDDTLAFQNMLNKSKNIKLSQNKIYKITTTLNIRDNTYISGFGVLSVIKSYIDDGTPLFYNNDNFTHFHFEDFYINGNNKNVIGVYLYKPFDACVIENMYFSGFYNSAIKIGNEDLIGQSLYLNNNIIYASQTHEIINPLIELTRIYEANITNNKILGHEPSPMAKACLELICCYNANVVGNSFAHTADCGVRIKSTANHDCRNNRIISNTYENITGDYSICLEGTSGQEVSSTLIVEANTYFNAPRLVYCSNENQGFIIGMDVTGGRRNVAFDLNSNKVLNAYNNTFITCDNKALSMSGIGLQGYDGKMRYRAVVNDSANVDEGMFITDSRNPNFRKEIKKSYEGNNSPGYRIKFVSPDGNTTKYLGIDNSGNLTAFDGFIS